MDSCWHLGSAEHQIFSPWLWNNPAPFLGQFCKHVLAELPGKVLNFLCLGIVYDMMHAYICMVQALHSSRSAVLALLHSCVLLLMIRNFMVPFIWCYANAVLLSCTR